MVRAPSLYLGGSWFESRPPYQTAQPASRSVRVLAFGGDWYAAARTKLWNPRSR